MPEGKAKRKPVIESMVVLNRRYEEQCPLDRLSLHPDNPRHGDIGNLHQSIEHNGFYGALVVQESTGHILAGNHRYQAAQQRGTVTIPVLWVDCSDENARRILLSDNRSSDLASWDNQSLAELLEQIKIDETQLGWQGTGWDDESFANLLADLSGPIFGEEASADDAGGSKEPATCPKCGYSLRA